MRGFYGLKPSRSLPSTASTMPRPASTTRPRRLLIAAAWGAGIVLLTPLIALGGLLAVLLGAAALITGALRGRVPAPRGTALRLPTAAADRGPAIADRQAA